MRKSRTHCVFGWTSLPESRWSGPEWHLSWLSIQTQSQPFSRTVVGSKRRAALCLFHANGMCIVRLCRDIGRDFVVVWPWLGRSSNNSRPRWRPWPQYTNEEAGNVTTWRGSPQLNRVDANIWMKLRLTTSRNFRPDVTKLVAQFPTKQIKKWSATTTHQNMECWMV